MSITLKQNVTDVLAVLAQHNYHVPSTGQAVRGDTQTVLKDLINAWRSSQRVSVMMWGTNLSTYLTHPDKAPPRFYRELTHATGLSDLGFEETAWHEADLAHQVAHAIKGGVLTTVASHPIDSSLFRMQPHAVEMGFKFSDEASRALPRFHNIHEFTVAAGEHLHTSSTMPFDGYLRVIASQDGEYIGLNDYLHISAHLHQGAHTFHSVPTDPVSPRTFVYAFACTELIFGKWPTGHDKRSRLSHGAFQHLVNAFFADTHERSSSVQSFITTLPAHA